MPGPLMGGGPGGPPGGGPPGGPHRGLGSVESDEIQVPDKMVGLSTYYTPSLFCSYCLQRNIIALIL